MSSYADFQYRLNHDEAFRTSFLGSPGSVCRTEGISLESSTEEALVRVLGQRDATIDSSYHAAFPPAIFILVVVLITIRIRF